MGFLEELNQEQRQAVEAEGPVLIVAGPGTGKTKTLTARISYLLTKRQVPAGHILALTFTKKAAEEMRLRTESLAAGARPHISTFHALCNELLGDDTPFVTEAVRLQIIKALPRPKELKELSARELGLVISRAKNLPQIDDPLIAKTVRAYNSALTKQNLRDFDDLLLGAYALLTRDEQKRRQVRAAYSHILVDEFQDTNRLQYELLKLLLGHQNLFVIGDPNQSIYGFRGARTTIFEQLKADFPKVRVIALTANYRSAPEIVRLSNAIFADAQPLKAFSNAPGAARNVEVLNEYAEADWVLNEIQRSIGGGDMLRAVSDDARSYHRCLSDFAVLYRNRSAASVLQKQVAASGLPYQVVGEGSPYEQPQIQSIIALLRAGVNHEPLPLEGFGSAQRHLLEDELTDLDDAVPHTLAEKLAAILGFEPSSALKQFTSVLFRFKDIKSVLNYIDEIAEHGFYDAEADAITLLTIHASKGLEFPVVFLIGAEEGILPNGRGDEAEERRLFYVAVTRARERLEILHARNRGGHKTEVSRFIRALPDEVLEHYIDPDIPNQIRRIAKRAAKKSQIKLF